VSHEVHAMIHRWVNTYVHAKFRNQHAGHINIYIDIFVYMSFFGPYIYEFRRL